MIKVWCSYCSHFQPYNYYVIDHDFKSNLIPMGHTVLRNKIAVDFFFLEKIAVDFGTLPQLIGKKKA